jgi:hypothetical protein
MNWFKVATIMSDDDRNHANARIRKMIALSELLRYAAKLIYQTARGARALAAEVGSNKTISSFPQIVDILTEADQLAMDSPRKFADLCKQAAQLLEEAVVDIEDDRHAYVEGLGKHKGLVDE